jgi:hypothetical protein
MVALFEYLVSGFDINIFAFWGVALCRLVDYTNVAEKSVILRCV